MVLSTLQCSWRLRHVKLCDGCCRSHGSLLLTLVTVHPYLDRALHRKTRRRPHARAISELRLCLPTIILGGHISLNTLVLVRYTTCLTFAELLHAQCLTAYTSAQDGCDGDCAECLTNLTVYHTGQIIFGCLLYMYDCSTWGSGSSIYSVLADSLFSTTCLLISKTRHTMKDLATTLAVWRHATIHELDITRRLLSSNLFASMGFQSCVLAGRLIIAPAVHGPTLLLLRFALIAITSAYGFEMCQQMMSVEEDRHNKPTRPIPAGMLTVQAAVQRCALSWILLPLALMAAVSIQASGWLLCSFAWTYFCYVWPRPRHWFFKNLFTAVYQIFFVRLVDSLVVLHTIYSGGRIVLDLIYATWVLATIHIQDFHDVEGDRKIGRKTLPVVLEGSTLETVRRGTAQFLVLFSTLAGIFGYQNSENWTVVLFAALQLAGAIATSLRLLRTESLEESERTYKLFYVPAGLVLVTYISLLNPVV